MERIKRLIRVSAFAAVLLISTLVLLEIATTFAFFWFEDWPTQASIQNSLDDARVPEAPGEDPDDRPRGSVLHPYIGYVRNAHHMAIQNDLFRKHATGNFAELVRAVTTDPAMLEYLDHNRQNRRAPNENFARELMELFTLGEGNYTEKDIKEAARAFTGWACPRGSSAAPATARPGRCR